MHVPDPAMMPGDSQLQARASGGAFLNVYRMLPALSQIDPELLQQLPWGVVFQLKHALLKESKAASLVQINTKMNMNVQQLAM
jgi:hypothetical protein